MELCRTVRIVLFLGTSSGSDRSGSSVCKMFYEFQKERVSSGIDDVFTVCVLYSVFPNDRHGLFQDELDLYSDVYDDLPRRGFSGE